MGKPRWTPQVLVMLGPERTLEKCTILLGLGFAQKLLFKAPGEDLGDLKKQSNVFV